MFSDLQLWIIIGVLFVLFIFGLLFLFSPGGEKRKRRRIPKPVKEKEQKDWKAASLRLEKHLVSLRKENVDWQKKTKILEKQADVYKQKCDDLKERLERESGWQKKEGADLSKKNQRIKEMEGDLKRIEQNLETEHSQLIVFRRENAELKHTLESQAGQIKALNAEAEKSKAQAEVYRKDIMELRAENKKLAQRHEDTQWIAKTVHDRVKEDLRQKQQECEHLRKEIIKKN